MGSRRLSHQLDRHARADLRDVEWNAPPALSITAIGGNHFEFCAGYQTGEGDISVRLVGQTEFRVAGRGFVRELGPDDDTDRFEPTWMPRPHQGADAGVLVDGRPAALLDLGHRGRPRGAERRRWRSNRCASSTRRQQHRSTTTASPSARARPSSPSTASRAGRLRTAFYGITFQPKIQGGDFPFVGAGDGIIGAISRNPGNNACTVSTVDLERNQHTIIATSNGLGFVPQSGVKGAGWDAPRARGRRARSGWSCHARAASRCSDRAGAGPPGTTLVDLETEQTTLNCMPPARNATFDHHPGVVRGRVDGRVVREHGPQRAGLRRDGHRRHRRV